MRIDRRSLMRSGIACAVVAGQGGGGAAAWVQGSAPVVHTRHGPVRGRTHSGVHVFKGVPYGADTSGAGRFRMPTDPEPWREVREAVTEGPQCPQRDPDEPLTALALPESEDCLTLNVWTPGPGDGRKRPVMVWLHGGGLWAGSAAGRFEDWPRIPGQPDRPDPRSIAGPWQEGGTLALRQDVVIVSPNHRINILGQLYLEEWDQDFQGSANVGMFDIVHALKWVRDNIERFGGDPGNVTIFGQSGGGQKVSILMAMPAAQGLFHKAICMSGPAPAVVGKPYAREMSRRLLERLGLTTEQVRRLQHVPVADVMRAMRAVTAEVGRNDVWGLIEGFAPVAGSYGLPGHPFWGDAPAASVDVPLLIGSTMTEMSFLVQPFPELARMDWGVAAERVQRLLGAHASAMMAVFRAAHPAESAWQIYSRILSHWPTRAFTLRIADNKARSDAPLSSSTVSTG